MGNQHKKFPTYSSTGAFFSPPPPPLALPGILTRMLLSSRPTLTRAGGRELGAGWHGFVALVWPIDAKTAAVSRATRLSNGDYGQESPPTSADGCTPLNIPQRP